MEKLIKKYPVISVVLLIAIIVFLFWITLKIFVKEKTNLTPIGMTSISSEDIGIEQAYTAGNNDALYKVLSFALYEDGRPNCQFVVIGETKLINTDCINWPVYAECVGIEPTAENLESNN